MPPAMADPDDLEDIVAVIALLKQHADELRDKGLPIDAIIRDLEEKLAEARAAAKKVRDLHALDEEFEREKVERRRELDAIVASLPPDLADGMSSLEYLRGITEREAERRRGGKKRIGG